MIKRLTFISLLITISLNLYGKNEVHFLFECNEEIKGPFISKIIFTLPEGKITRQIEDTSSIHEILNPSNFKAEGKYGLSIYFESEYYGKDSIDFGFELKGNEIKTILSIEFHLKEQIHKKGRKYKKGENILNGYIRIEKFYDAPKTIEISPDKEYPCNIHYKGPFFRIKNNSTDTLYGEHLRGYFWGTLSFIRNDSVLLTRTGVLDYNFSDSPPLYPNSTKIASVGSFGLKNKLTPFEYRFEVMVATRWQSTGTSMYENRKNFVWWAGTKEYFKLQHDFKVE